jgi:hypothetical protein
MAMLRARPPTGTRVTRGERGSCAAAQQGQGEFEGRPGAPGLVGGLHGIQGAAQGLAVTLEGAQQAWLPGTAHEQEPRARRQRVDDGPGLGAGALETGGGAVPGLHARARVQHQHGVAELAGGRQPRRAGQRQTRGQRDQQQQHEAQVPQQAIQPEAAMTLTKCLAPKPGARHAHPPRARAQQVQRHDDRQRGERDQGERVRQLHQPTNAPSRR